MNAYDYINTALSAGRCQVTLPDGTFREKLHIDCTRLYLRGSGQTTITWDDCALKQHEDGTKYGTFRSYTAFFRAQMLRLENLTIENSAGSGKTHGQAIAAYFDCRRAYIKNCRFIGNQDTIFTAPLPPSPVIPNSFVGPNDNLPRLPSLLYFKDCYIEGDVDFIFGGAAAIFDNCVIHSVGSGYVSAPSTPEHQTFGYIFKSCRFTGDCPQKSVFAARPWREFGACALIDCTYAGHISPLLWDDWDNPVKREHARFSESCTDQPQGRASFGSFMTPEQRAEHLAFIKDAHRALMSEIL